jgi:hypothetical protein
MILPESSELAGSLLKKQEVPASGFNGRVALHGKRSILVAILRVCKYKLNFALQLARVGRNKCKIIEE